MQGDDASSPKARPEDIDRAPDKLPPDPADAGVPTRERFQDDARRLGDENFELKAEIARLKSELSTRQELDRLIKPFARNTFVFMCCYCIFAAIVLVASGFGRLDHFEIPTNVLQVLVGSTAVTVFGLVGTVLTGIFIGSRK